MLRDRLGVSERWACRVVGQHRSTQRREPKRAEDDAALRAELRKFSKDRPRWGYRRAHHHLRELGWEVNRKRVQRLWREEGLRVPVRRRKRRRVGDSTVLAQRLRAERPNQVWALDFQHDQTACGRVLKLLNVVDEFTREALEMLVERSIDADTTVSVLERLVAERGAPEYLRMDNGPELTAHALKDWCRFCKTGTAYIDPGSPWQNPFVESFHSRVRDEPLDVEEFSCLAEAKVVIADWQADYNERRPHSALGMKTPSSSPPHGPCPPLKPHDPRHATRSGRISSARSARSARCGEPTAPPDTLPQSPSTHSHPGWTDKRGPARVVARAQCQATSGVDVVANRCAPRMGGTGMLESGYVQRLGCPASAAGNGGSAAGLA